MCKWIITDKTIINRSAKAPSNKSAALMAKVQPNRNQTPN